MGRFLFVLAAFGLLAGAAAAEPLVGTWQTELDAKNTRGHVRIVPCEGDKFCGTVTSAWDKAGNQIVTPNVGKRILWNVAPSGGGQYNSGRVYVPIMHADFPVELQMISGNSLRLKACNAVGMCARQTWTRVN